MTAVSESKQREQNAQHYLQAHRNANYTGLPAAHRAEHKQTMRELEQRDPGVRERATFGTARHTGQLDSADRSYQRHLQSQYSQDEIGEHRRNLDSDRRASDAFGETHAGRTRRAPPRPPQTRARRAATYVRQTARTAATVPSYVRSTADTPSPPSSSGGGLGLFYGALVAGVGFSMLYLLLTRAKTASGLLSLASTSFQHLTSPTTALFPASSSSSAALNNYLGTPAISPAAAAAQAVPSATAIAQAVKDGAKAVTAPSLAAQAAAQGLHFNPSTDTYVG